MTSNLFKVIHHNKSDKSDLEAIPRWATLVSTKGDALRAAQVVREKYPEHNVSGVYLQDPVEFIVDA